MKILIIEDEFILATDLSNTLEAEGYEVVFVADNGSEALDFYQKNEVDLFLCDIHIKGEWDGIETAKRLTDFRPSPIIYLTAFTDTETLERAKVTYPAAYIPKPYHIVNLRMAIEMAINNFAMRVHPMKILKDTKADGARKEAILQINEYIFIKQNYQFVKFRLDDILYLEAESIYTNIITFQKKYVIRQTVGSVLDRLPINNLVRIHRSYAVNIHRIESFNEHEVTINGQAFPLGRSFKDEFMRQFMFR